MSPSTLTTGIRARPAIYAVATIVIVATGVYAGAGLKVQSQQQKQQHSLLHSPTPDRETQGYEKRDGEGEMDWEGRIKILEGRIKILEGRRGPLMMRKGVLEGKIEMLRERGMAAEEKRRAGGG